MKEFLTEFGRKLYDLGIAQTRNGLPPKEWQCFGLGLYLFIVFCFGTLFLLIVIIEKIYNLIIKRKEKTKNGR